jgi:hypothetical protein
LGKKLIPRAGRGVTDLYTTLTAYGKPLPGSLFLWLRKRPGRARTVRYGAVRGLLTTTKVP